MHEGIISVCIYGSLFGRLMPVRLSPLAGAPRRDVGYAGLKLQGRALLLRSRDRVAGAAVKGCSQSAGRAKAKSGRQDSIMKPGALMADWGKYCRDGLFLPKIRPLRQSFCQYLLSVTFYSLYLRLKTRVGKPKSISPKSCLPAGAQTSCVLKRC